MKIEDAVHTFVALGNKMSTLSGLGWSPQIIQTERGWGLITCYEHNGSSQAKWSNGVLEKEDLDSLYDALSVLCESRTDKDGFQAICDFLDTHGFNGKLPVTGDTECYALPAESEFLVKLEYLPAEFDLSM